MLNPYIYSRFPFAPCIINEFLYFPCNSLNSAYFNHMVEVARRYDLNPLDALIGGGI